MNLNLTQVPFSRFGSYFAVSELAEKGNRQKGLYLRSVHGDTHPSELFRIDLMEDGNPVPFTVTATPWVLTMESEHGRAEVCIHDLKTVKFRTSGVGIRLSMDDTGYFNYAFQETDERWQLNSHNRKFSVEGSKGSFSVDAPWTGYKSEKIILHLTPDSENPISQLDITEYQSSRPKDIVSYDFDESVAKVKAEFEDWLKNTIAVPVEYSTARELASYICWSSVVAPEGHYKRPSMLMSKNHMNGIWSWDHCFNAMALTGNSELSWDQIMTIFDHQDSFGSLPDTFNDVRKITNFCKPPIHGWAIDRLLDRSLLKNEQLEEIYPCLVNWTNWWFEYRDEDGDGLPEYNHGNDSGWDNATVFLGSAAIESPDLLAYLVYGMDVLSKIASILGNGEAQEWKLRADRLFEKMTAELWDGNRFFARDAYTHKRIESQSLLPYMPIILGKRLSKQVLSSLVRDLKENFTTPYGVASENPSSPLYKEDGYWRGPIWAPTTMIIVSGLKASGETEFATELSRKFCNMVMKSGLAENYNALTGEGLRDRSFTWTSSVFLMLANGLKEQS